MTTRRIILSAGALLLAGSVAQSQSGFVASVVDLEIIPEHLEKFLVALKENGAETVKEPGCRRYEILQSSTNANQIFIYEVYDDQAAVQFHRATDHFKKYQIVTKDMVSKRQSRPMVSVATYAK